MTTIKTLRSIAERTKSFPNKKMKNEYLNNQSREVLNFLSKNIRMDNIGKVVAGEIPKSTSSQSTMEDVVRIFNDASVCSGRLDKIASMQYIILSPEDRSFVLKCLYDSLKIGVSIAPPAPMFGDPFRPQLCGTSTDFNPKSYLMEEKFDGIRCIGMNIDDKIRLYTRNGKPLSVELIEAELLDFMPPNCVVDGEIVASDGQFQSLQRHGDEIEYRVFDMPFFNGSEITGMALSGRRNIIEENLHETDMIRISPLLSLSNMTDIDKWISNNDAEGVVAKDPAGSYIYGGRKDWIKVKPFLDVTCRVTGFTKGTGKRDRNDMIGSISVIPIGSNIVTNVGTGFSDVDLIQMRLLLRENKNITVDIKYQELTNDGCMRFPVFLRIRDVT